MKKSLRKILAIALVCMMVVPCAISAFAADGQLQLNDKNWYGNSVKGGDGFVEGNLTFTETIADDLSDVTVEINGYPAYWNVGYLGNRHCQLRNAPGDDPLKSSLEVGLVGVKLNEGEQNTFKLTAKNGKVYETTFTSSCKAIPVSYAKVVCDRQAKNAKIEVAFAEDPGFKVGDTFEGRTHDEHNAGSVNATTFKVTAYDTATKVYTLESQGEYTTTHSLFEIKCTTEGANKDVWFSVTINTMAGTFIGDKKVTEKATKIDLTEVKANRADDKAANLKDGTDEKYETGEAPKADNPIEITFKTATAVKPDYFVMYTGNDDATWNNRAPNAFKLYGVKEDETEVLILDKAESGLQNVNFTPFAYEIDPAEAYSTFKLVITSQINGAQGHFQLGEIELYTGNVTVSENDRYATVQGPSASIGTEPKAPAGGDKTEDNKPTGDATLAFVLVSFAALIATAAVVAKKRRTVC